jgi:hypothetical protein
MTMTFPDLEEEQACMHEMAECLNQLRIILHTLLYAAALTGTERAQCRAAETQARAILARATRLGLIQATRP